MKKLVASIALVAICGPLSAQYNTKGTIHLGIGLNLAGHSTHYEQTFLGFTMSEDDGAASITFPIDFQYGFSKMFSLGLFLEPGHYLDSTDSQFNNLALFGIQPRFYLVNKERFSWMASLQLGTSGMRIHNEENDIDTDYRWSGGFFGLSTGVGFAFTDHFGLQAHLRYMATSFKLRDLEIEGDNIDLDNFEATLDVRGVGLQISAMFRL